MRDIAREINLKKIDAPTLHGYVDIITKTKHGLVERVSGENTFQASVLAKVLDRNGELGLPMLNSYTDSVGGILLFDKAIPANSEFMPAGTKMVAHGYRGCTTQGTYPLLGTYNTSESSTSAQAITQVYDYATNQANGTIKAVSLTSYSGGVIGYGVGNNAPWNSYRLGNYAGSGLGGEEGARGGYYNGYRYYPLGVSDGVLSIQKMPVNVTKGNIFRGLAKTLTFDLAELGITPRTVIPYWTIVWDIGGGKFRFWSEYEGYNGNAPVVANDGSIYYYEFDATTETLSQGTITNTSGDSIRLGNYGVAFLDDKCFIANYGDNQYTTVYIFDVTNNTFIRKINTASNFAYYNGQYAPTYLPGEITDGLYLMSAWNPSASQHYSFLYDSVNDTTERMNLAISTTGDFSQVRKMKSVSSIIGMGFGRAAGSSYGWACIEPWYLATIYNLSTAVTKDASMTMKVIYTLTEA